MPMPRRTIASVPADQATPLPAQQGYSPSPILLAGLFSLPSLLLLAVVIYRSHRTLKRQRQVERLERMWRLDLSQRSS